MESLFQYLVLTHECLLLPPPFRGRAGGGTPPPPPARLVSPSCYLIFPEIHTYIPILLFYPFP